MRLIDRVQPIGINRPVDVFELMAARPGLTKLPASLEASEAQLELCALWDRAYETYVEQDWQRALAAFEVLLNLFPNDNPARVFVGRCRDFIDTAPEPHWDGVTQLNRK